MNTFCSRTLATFHCRIRQMFNVAVCFSLASGFTSWGAEEVPAPIAHWNFDDEVAPKQPTSAQGTHVGLITGAVSQQGKFGKALLFDRAKGDHVSISHSSDFEIGSHSQISAWVWLTKWSQHSSGILGTRTGGEFNFDMKVNADKVHGDIGDGTNWIDTKVNFYKDDVGSNGQGGDLELRRWYLITFVVEQRTKGVPVVSRRRPQKDNFCSKVNLG